MIPVASDDFSYLNRSLTFKVRKILRYSALDGVSKTLGKVRAQYHMARTETFDTELWVNPTCRSPESDRRFVGLIGCGKFGYSMLSFYLHRHERRFLRGAYDISRSRSLSLCRDYQGAYAASSPQQIIRDPKIRLVYIASNHATHAEYAIQCLEAGKCVHIEKPQVVNEEQLDRLLSAQARNPGAMVFLGFNRPRSPHFTRIMKILDAQSGPVTINWFIAGHEIPKDNWYFSPSEGGRILGNLCHWTDLSLAMVGVRNAFPIEVVPACDPLSKSEFNVGMKFADGSLAAITFSAKGHTFEGVHEILNAHRGDAIVSLTDFKVSAADIAEKKYRYTTLHRNHGHRENILNSYLAVKRDDHTRAISPDHNKATARLFLGVREAIEEGHSTIVNLN